MLAVWRSRSASLLPSLSVCHAAAGSRLLWSQLSAQLEIISLSLSANSRHAAVNITSLSPSLLLHPHLSVPWIKWRVLQLHGKSFFSDGKIISFSITVELRKGQVKIASVILYDYFFVEIEAHFPLKDMCSPPCSMMLITWLENKWPEVLVVLYSYASLTGCN